MRSKKTLGREYAMQMLYSSLFSDNSVEETKLLFRLEYNKLPDSVLNFAGKLFEMAYNNREKDEMIISELINKKWTIDRIGSVEKCILRLGISELFEGKVPHYVIINDYVTLTRNYCDDKAVSFINGVLENVKSKFCVELDNGKK